jgi:transposase
MKIITERIDDIPVIIGTAMQLDLVNLVNQHIGTHGSQKGLSNGELLVGWLAYMLSQGDHKKSSVQDWSNDLKETLGSLLRAPLRDIDFSDDRLGNLTRRFSNDKAWEELEASLWSHTLTVYNPTVNCIRLDSTSSYGYHTLSEDGFMQFGVSKDHRPDLPQIKLMAGCCQPSGHLLGVDIRHGNRADDPLYIPLIQRIRGIVNQSGMLYSGDCKMASLETRAELVSHGDYYLMPLALVGNTGKDFEEWINAVIIGSQSVECIYNENKLLCMGYEFDRPQEATLNGKPLNWLERVQLLRSPALAESKAENLENRLSQAESKLFGLTPEPGRGKRQIVERKKLDMEIGEVLRQYKVEGLLEAKCEVIKSQRIHYKGRGRGGANRETIKEEQVRYKITDVIRKEDEIAGVKYRMGWRAYVTNAPKEKLSLSQSVLCYREGNILERDFHLLKDTPIGIGPLYVWKDDQIKGMTRILTIALRLLTMIEIQVREGIQQDGEPMKGLYSGQPNRATSKPTGKRILKAFVRKITLTDIKAEESVYRHISPLSALHQRILRYLKLSDSIYTELKFDNSM